MERPPNPAAAVTAPAASIPDKFVLPPTLVTPHKWTDTIAVSRDTASQGVWVRNEHGIYAHRKPGIAIPNSHETLREIVCNILAGWIGVPTPRMELLEHEHHGACLLSYDLPDGQTYRWYSVMELKVNERLYADAFLQLENYAGPVTVLDILVGACDRRNSGNHLYVERERRWYTIDYGFSFNRFPDRFGVGDPAAGYGTVLKQEAWPEIIQAIGRNKGLLNQALNIVELIPDETLDALLLLPPEPFGDEGTRGQMSTFLKYRRSRIRDLVRVWCEKVGLAGAVT